MCGRERDGASADLERKAVRGEEAIVNRDYCALNCRKDGIARKLNVITHRERILA